MHKVYQRPLNQKKIGPCPLPVALFFNYLIHNLDDNELSFLFGELKENKMDLQDIIIGDFFKWIGLNKVMSVQDYTVALFDLVMPIPQTKPEKSRSIGIEELLFSTVASEDLVEKNLTQCFEIQNQDISDEASHFLDITIKAMLGEKFGKYKELFDSAQDVFEINSLIVLAEINMCLERRHAECLEIPILPSTKEDTIYKLLANSLKNPKETLLQETYNYFVDKDSLEGLCKTFKKGFNMYPSHYFELFKNRIDNLNNSHQVAKAKQLFQGIYSQNLSLPQKLKIKKIEAKFYEEQKEPLTSAKIYVELLEAQPTNDVYWDSFITQAEKLENSSEISSIFEQIKDSNFFEFLPLDAKYITNLYLGYIDLCNGKYKKSMELFSESIRINPKESQAWEYKFHVLNNKSTPYYNPPNFENLTKLLELAKTYGVKLN